VTPQDQHHSVSVVLLTFNGETHLPRTLPLLLGQRYSGTVEIIAVDSSPSGGTAELLRQHGINVLSIAPEAFHHARTRNWAASQASGELLVFLSQDAEPVDDLWLQHLVKPFDDPEVAAVYGRQIPPSEIGEVRRRAMQSIYPEQREIRQWSKGTRVGLQMLRFSNANSAIRRSAWEAAPFPADVFVAEDHWMCYAALKAGHKVVYEPSAAVYHGHERSLWEEFCWAVDNGVSLRRMGIFADPLVGGELAYGLRRLVDDWAHFLQVRKPALAVGITAVNAAKWAGVQIGKREQMLPKWMLRVVSGGARRFDDAR
jgi:rhamnosyltransferase